MIGLAVNQLQKGSISFKGLMKNPNFTYKTLSAEDYLFNQRDSNLANKVKSVILNPLGGCNHSEGSSDEILLMGAPLGTASEFYKEYDDLARSFTVNKPDLIFI